LHDPLAATLAGVTVAPQQHRAEPAAPDDKSSDNNLDHPHYRYSDNNIADSIATGVGVPTPREGPVERRSVMVGLYNSKSVYPCLPAA
jgi:hypothetical protein